MTAVLNTLEKSMKQEVSYGAIDDTNNPETTKIPNQITRPTYVILLFVISSFFVAGADAGAGVTWLYLRYNTASIVALSEHNSISLGCGPNELLCGYKCCTNHPYCSGFDEPDKCMSVLPMKLHAGLLSISHVIVMEGKSKLMRVFLPKVECYP